MKVERFEKNDLFIHYKVRYAIAVISFREYCIISMRYEHEVDKPK